MFPSIWQKWRALRAKRGSGLDALSTRRAPDRVRPWLETLGERRLPEGTALLDPTQLHAWAAFLVAPPVVSAQLQLSTACLAFGNQPVGTPGTPHTVTLYNFGTTPVTVTDVSLTSGDFAFSPAPLPLYLVPGADSSCSVRFTPTAEGVRTGLLTFHTDAGDQTVSLAGLGTSAANAANAHEVDTGHPSPALSDEKEARPTSPGQGVRAEDAATRVFAEMGRAPEADAAASWTVICSAGNAGEGAAVVFQTDSGVEGS